jgi:UDP-glucose 4-epimerase
MRYVILPYFNVAGAQAPELGDFGVFNLIPLVFRALYEGRPPQVFGDDYDTEDGSCIRDYIHVVDLARAPVAPAKRLETEDCAETYNVGRGEGSSVKEVMPTVCKVLGRDFGYVIGKRRPGDPTKVVGVVDKIRNELGWVAEHDLESMVRSAWQAWGLGCPLLTDYPHADGWRALAVLPCQRFHWGCRAVGDFFQQPYVPSKTPYAASD